MKTSAALRLQSHSNLYHPIIEGAVEPLYNENIIIWQITLHAITKETAQEAEASGLPIGEGSDYDTYAEGKSKEDYERMASAIDIDASHGRLTKVQKERIDEAAT